MRTYTRLEPQHDLIVRMASEHQLSWEIAEATGTSAASIRTYIYKHQIPWEPDKKRSKPKPSACRAHHETVKAMAEAGAAYQMIAEAVGTTRHRVREYLEREDIRRPDWCSYWRSMTGPLNPMWNGGRMTDKDGYVLLWMPGHPEANHHGQVREHRIVMARVLGRPLRPGEVVDHRNDIRDDNRPENLRLFASNAEHLSVTLTGRKSRASRGLPPSNRKPSRKRDQQSLPSSGRPPE